MCDTGGPRCEYSNKWLSEKRKLQRTARYKNSGSFEQEKLEKAAKEKFQKENSTLFQAHMPTREKWQTKAKPLPRRKMEAISKSFPKPTILTAEEAALHTNAMKDEYEKMREIITREENGTLMNYAGIIHSLINTYLRTGQSEDGDPESIPSLEKHVARMDSVFKKMEPQETERTLYRHMIIPKGIAPRAFAEKYFKVGERVRDNAFMSTTEDPAYIRGHVFKRRPSEYVVFQIVSSKGISLQRQDEQVGSVQAWEKERLLPRGTNLRVVGIRNEEFAIAEEREECRKQFSRSAFWAEEIPPKRLVVIQLIDEDNL